MQITKRDGRKEQFNKEKIQKALEKCFKHIGDSEFDFKAKSFTEQVLGFIPNNPSVEQIQNAVESFLCDTGENDAYIEYSSYRKERELIRNLKSKVPQGVVEAFNRSKKYFPSPTSEIQFYDKMSRFIEEKGRRETWEELVDERLMPFYRKLSDNKLSEEEYTEIRDYIINLKAEGSFRLFSAAGAAAERDNTCIYNCAYHPICSIEDFGEDLYISMCGTGIGSSVEDYYISQLPEVKPQTGEKVEFIFEDTTESWAEGTTFAIKSWYDGKDVDFDFSKLRKKGAVLKTKGGRASGPDPLINSLKEAKSIILGAEGRKLYSDEVADIICCFGDCPGQGGVRRAAKIIVCDFADERMRKYKHGNILKSKPYRQNANISEAFVRDYSFDEIKQYVYDMHASTRGENGIFSRINTILNAPQRRKDYWERKSGLKITKENAVLISLMLGIGVNPCGEINTSAFCNLSVAVAPGGDLMNKLRIATILGTIQSKATYFPNLKSKWKEISEEDRLLGVDIIGQADVGFLSKEEMIEARELVISVNKEYAEKLGTTAANANTTTKPSGNASQFFSVSPGFSRPKHKYWIRNIEIPITSPVYKVLKHSKVPGFPKPEYETSTYIFSIPQKAPDGAKIKEDDTLKEQLDYWKLLKLNYTEHNPSCTIEYDPDTELDELVQWVYDNQNILGGLTFFPKFDLSKLGFSYLPIQKIEEEEYKKRIEEFPEINWELLWIFEKEDHTVSAQEIACVSGACTF